MTPAAPGPDGLLVVDKPCGWTSHDVVAVVRALAGTRRVGHAGTLDPMATGVLVLGVGRGTRLLTFLVGCDKSYTATIRLGQATVTDDAEGEVTTTTDPRGVGQEAVASAIRSLTGPIEQVPSAVSAIKVAGVRSYARVRAGREVALTARPVVVERFEVRELRRSHVDGSDADGLEVLDLDVEVDVSSGTYVRALARDLGAALGVGGHLTRLRRTRVGRFDVAHAHPLDHLRQAGTPLPLVSLADAARASLCTRVLDPDQVAEVGHGRRIPSERPGGVDPVAAFGPGGELVAILDESGPLARTKVVFVPA